MSSGSSGYDPKYTSLDPNARADGKRYQSTRQKQSKKKDEKKLKPESTKKSAEGEKPSLSTSKKKVSLNPHLDFRGFILTSAVEMRSVVNPIASDPIPPNRRTSMRRCGLVAAS